MSKLSKQELKNRALVFDAKSMRFEEWNGHLRVQNTNLTKANICEYYGFEIANHDKYGLEPEQKYRFLRSPDALEKAVGSFKERPILYVHKAADASKLDNSKVIGTTGSDPSFSYPYIQSSITIWDGDYIQAIKENKQAELSASYAFTPVMESGTFEGEVYDGIMTDIHVDHVALVEQGRAGSDVRVADAVLGENMQKLNKMGLKITQTIHSIVDQSGMVGNSKGNEIAKIVAMATGTQKQNLVPVVTSLLKGYAIASDEEAKQVGEEVKKVMDADQDKVDDEDPVDTVEKDSAQAGDEEPDKDQKPSASDEDNESDKTTDQASTGNAKPDMNKQRLTAFDAAIFEQKVTEKVRQDLRQAQEARNSVKPLVGEWATASDSGVDILREALTYATGKAPPASMNYDHLKYTVDMVISQKQQQGRANDHKFMARGDLERFGATRLGKI